MLRLLKAYIFQIIIYVTRIIYLGTTGLINFKYVTKVIDYLKQI